MLLMPKMNKCLILRRLLRLLILRLLRLPLKHHHHHRRHKVNHFYLNHLRNLDLMGLLRHLLLLWTMTQHHHRLNRLQRLRCR